MSEIEVLKDQIESLQAALIAKEETHRIEIEELKGKALNAFLECDGYDKFEREINYNQIKKESNENRNKIHARSKGLGYL